MKIQQLPSILAVAVGVLAVGQSSSFAESSPQNRTSGTNIIVRGERSSDSATTSRKESSRDDSRGSIERRERRSSDGIRLEGRTAPRERVQRDDSPRATRDREVTRRDRDRAGRDNDGRIGSERGGASRDRNDDGRIRRDRRGYEHDRDRTATRNHARGWSGTHYSGRQPYHAHGRISRLSPWGNGYYVWVGGARYPFYVPHSYYRRHGLRIGININIGGYYNDRGYYEYYEDDYYRDRYDYRAEVRGYVQDVDYRRDEFLVRDSRTGRRVRIDNRDGRLRVREGDYVEVSGEWSRSGLFRAYDVDILDGDRYRRRY